ncbi:MAG: hypothetical protein PHO90_01000, partial [Candidatus Pacebacteria bacterium]|nr:hypothetical protein [Candidatus Paceibacterota bacterium]
MKNKKKKISLPPLKAISTVIAFSLMAGLALFLYFIKDLPRPEVFTESEMNQVTKIYDRKGEMVLSSVYG